MELDVTPVKAFVDNLRTTPQFQGVRLTINMVMLKIIAEAVKESPDLNATIDYNKRNGTGKMHYRDAIDIAMPMMTPAHRMITPVLRDVGGNSLAEVCSAMETLTKRAYNTNIDLLLHEAAIKDTLQRLRQGQLLTVFRRLWANFVGAERVALPSRAEREEYYKIPESERLTAADLLEASMLVTNVGSLMPGLRCHVALLEIIAPAVVAFGMAGIQKKPVVVTNDAGEDTMEIRHMLPFTMYGDHRAIDFAHAAGFLDKLLQLCANPEMLIQ